MPMHLISVLTGSSGTLGGMLAKIVLLTHLLFILYIVIGFPVGLVINHRWFRWVHAGLLGGVTLLMIAGLPCPLTVVEEMLSAESYEGSFLATWLNRIIYLEGINPQTVFYIDLVFAALVFSSFWWRPLKKRIRENSPH